MSQTFTDFVTNATALASADPGDLFAIVDISASVTKSLTRTALKTSLVLSKSDVSLGNVENTALSTWAGGTSITTLGTISSGTWNGTVINGAYLPSDLIYIGDVIPSSDITGVFPGASGGTGVANSGKTITLGGNLTTSGSFALTFTLTAGTGVTLPTSGTLSTLAGSESLTNKKLGSLTTNGFVITSSSDGTLSVTVPATGILTFLETPSSANLASAVTNETGSGALVFATSPTLVTPALGTPSSGVLTSCTIPVFIQLSCSDLTTAITSGTTKAYFRMPFAMTVTDVRASVLTAPTGSTAIFDINEGGTTILATKLSIDAGESTSTTAATPPVISDSALADDAQMTIDFDQVGASVAGAGVVICLIGTKP